MLFRREGTEKLQGLRVHPVGVPEEKEKRRVIHDLTIQVGGGTGEEGRPVNATTFYDEIPECEMATEMRC